MPHSGVNRTILSEITSRKGKDAQDEYIRTVTGDATRAASKAVIKMKNNKGARS